MFEKQYTECPVAPDSKHEPLATPNWTDEDDEIISGFICRLCGEELG